MVDLAFLWHMHQPNYRDPQSGELALPWVRLHACRAYYDMAWLLERHPSIKGTFNFVPILMEQLQAMVDGERDVWFQLARKPARELSGAERAFLLKHFFSVHAEGCIRPRPRYWSLYNRRSRGGGPAGLAHDFGERDLRDLQVLFNLAWFGFAARVEYPLIDALDRKGRDFSEDDKRKLLDLQIAVMRRVVPMYRRLAERGQIELTSTPYHHPILPLVIDSEAAERCQPDRARPPRFSYPQDAELQVQRAISSHTEHFGAPPRGFWPAEGSVSPEALALLSANGVQWAATDEAQLWKSLPGEERRADLYRPYRVTAGGADLNMVFRDRAMSDLIGFTYARNPAEVGVADLIRRVREAGQSMAGHKDEALVLIALDGENPWEYYPESGRPFLERLYSELGAAEDIRTVNIADHLEAHPPQRSLARIHSGSWINGDYGIWMGGAVENAAWAALGEARRFFAKVAEAGHERLEEAREHILTAEGSDWFWWYGDTFHSEQDGDFDRLFRGHLQQVYAKLGAEPPAALDRSLYPSAPSVEQRPPKGLVTPRFGEARSTFFDWAGAGVLDLSGPASSMYQGTRWFARLRYGFDLQNLYARLEPPSGVELDLEGVVIRVRVRGEDDHYAEFPLDDLSTASMWRLGPDLHPTETSTLSLHRRTDSLVELGLPFAKLHLVAGQSARVTVHLLKDRVELDRYPPAGELEFRVPDEHFESHNWSA